MLELLSSSLADWPSNSSSASVLPASIRTNPESARLAMADIGSNAVASTQAGSRILRMFIPLSRDARQWAAEDRKSVVLGKGVSVRVDFGGSGIIKKKKKNNQT